MASAAIRGPADVEDDLISDVGRDARSETSGEEQGGAPGPRDGAVAIAAITSCTNTTDPKMLLAAGLLARKARERGLAPPPWVKTSLAPGSPAAADYLRRSGLLTDLEALGFGIVGFGCTTCIGNSGPLVPVMAEAIQKRGVVAAAVLSGNRNFPGRVHGMLDHAFLASPPLVVAYALAGRVDLDIAEEPIGLGRETAPVFLADIWPSDDEIDGALAAALRSADFVGAFADQGGGAAWSAIEAPSGPRFPWETQLDLPAPATVRGAARPPDRRPGAERCADHRAR